MKEKKNRMSKWSVSGIIVFVVTSLTMTVMVIGVIVFAVVYQKSVTQNAMIASEQAAVQVSNIVENYLMDMRKNMEQLREYYKLEKKERNEVINTLVAIQNEVVSVTAYNLESREMLFGWTGEQKMKKKTLKNLSVEEWEECGKNEIYISSPHVESILKNDYPWVVSVCSVMTDSQGQKEMVVMDMSFSQIAGYVDDVGIGAHGYCFIMDREGNIVYHPQQQLIFAGLKSEYVEMLSQSSDGTFQWKGGIYTLQTKESSGWRIVAVSFINEMITERVKSVVLIICFLLLALQTITMAVSIICSRMIGRPVEKLEKAMKEFEKRAEDFVYHPVHGSREIEALSVSLGHMIQRIQELMEQVRREEVTLRKTELRALQAQINPHFLYNTLDSIGWMCEEGRNQDAVEMVNALARLFRISISKGHELIPIEKEVEHAKSYLQIQKFRYKDQFTYDFQVDEECLKYYCNKITIQPFIENAIYHGLDRMVDEGHIQICIRQENDRIAFTVEDNGVGMTEEEQKGLLKRESGDKTGIGIKNVNDRIKIYFGEEYGVKIESELDEGTKITITMPKLEGENL